MNFGMPLKITSSKPENHAQPLKTIFERMGEKTKRRKCEAEVELLVYVALPQTSPSAIPELKSGLTGSAGSFRSMFPLNIKSEINFNGRVLCFTGR